MKIAVIGDTHNEKENISLFFKKIRSITNFVIHLGDDISDVVGYETSFKIEKVPGVYEEIYSKNIIPNRKIIQLNGIKILLTHSPAIHQNDLNGDINPEEAAKFGVNVVLYAHTHIPKIEKKGEILWLNPGHLKEKDKKGYPPTYALIEINKNQIDAQIKELYTEKTIQNLSTII